MVLKMINKIVALTIILSLVIEQSGFAQVVGPMGVPAYINGYISPDKFRPLLLRSLSFDQINNDFDLFLDKGDLEDLKPKEIKENAAKLSEYFQIGLRLPNSTFWVNLRPDAQDQIIDPWLEKTDLGKVMLEADLQLKKDMANFTSPRTEEGKKYWDNLYKKAEELFGQSEITIPTLTRPWIVPGEILIRETADNAYIYKAVLKVMLEQDHLKDYQEYKFDDPRLKILNEYSSELIRREILPKLTREVNSSKKYVGLRQVYYSLVLAQWFKQSNLVAKSQFSNKIDSFDLGGLTSKKDWSKATYFKAYQKSFSKGEYKLQETVNRLSGTSIRQYFSGGEQLFIPKGGIVRINPLADGGVSNQPSLPESLGKDLIKVPEEAVDDAGDQQPVKDGNNSDSEGFISRLVKRYNNWLDAKTAEEVARLDARIAKLKEEASGLEEFIKGSKELLPGVSKIGVGLGPEFAEDIREDEYDLKALRKEIQLLEKERSRLSGNSVKVQSGISRDSDRAEALGPKAQELYSAINEIGLRISLNREFVARRVERVKSLLREKKYSSEEIRMVMGKLNLMDPINELVAAGKSNSLLFSVGAIFTGALTLGALVFSGMSLVPMLIGIGFTAAFGTGAGYSLYKLFYRDIPMRDFYFGYDKEINKILAAAEDATRGLEMVNMVRKLAAEQYELRDRYLGVSLPRSFKENSDAEKVKSGMFEQKKEFFKAALVLREVAKAYGAPVLTYDQIEKNDVVVSYEARDSYWFLALSGAEAQVQYSYVQKGFIKERFFSVNKLQKILENALAGEGQGLKDGGQARIVYIDGILIKGINAILDSSENHWKQMNDDPFLNKNRKLLIGEIRKIKNNAIDELAGLVQAFGKDQVVSYLNIVIASPDFSEYAKGVSAKAIPRIKKSSSLDGGSAREQQSTIESILKRLDEEIMMLGRPGSDSESGSDDKKVKAEVDDRYKLRIDASVRAYALELAKLGTGALPVLREKAEAEAAASASGSRSYQRTEVVSPRLSCIQLAIEALAAKKVISDTVKAIRSGKKQVKDLAEKNVKLIMDKKNTDGKKAWLDIYRDMKNSQPWGIIWGECDALGEIKSISSSSILESVAEPNGETYYELMKFTVNNDRVYFVKDNRAGIFAESMGLIEEVLRETFRGLDDKLGQDSTGKDGGVTKANIEENRVTDGSLSQRWDKAWNNYNQALLNRVKMPQEEWRESLNSAQEDLGEVVKEISRTEAFRKQRIAGRADIYQGRVYISGSEKDGYNNPMIYTGAGIISEFGASWQNLKAIDKVVRKRLLHDVADVLQAIDSLENQETRAYDGGTSFTKEELKSLVNSPAAFGHFLRFRQKRFNGLNAPLKPKATRERLIKLFESQRDAEAIIWEDTQSDGLMEDVDVYFRIMKRVGFNFRELGLLSQATGAFNYFYKTKLIPQGSRKAMDKEERDAKRQLMAAVVERTREAAKRRDSQLAGILSSVEKIDELEMLIRGQLFINSLRKLEFNLTDELKALVNPSLTESAGVFEDFFNKAFPSARPDGDNYRAQMFKVRFRLQQLLARASLINDEPVIKIILSVESEAQLVLAIRAQQYITYLKQYGFDINFLRRFSGASDSKNELEHIFAADKVSKEFLEEQLLVLRDIVKRMSGRPAATPTVIAMLSVESGKEIRLLKKIQAYENSRSSRMDAKDGGTTSVDRLGGIDFRAMPAVVTPMVNPAAGAGLISLKDLDKQWSDIQSKIYQGDMPYQEIKLYVSSCCGNKAACKQLEKVSEGITNILKMEEERALPTAPELKEILACLG